MKENKFNPMGFLGHPISSDKTLIPRKSRWLLTNNDHPNIHYWMKSMKTDYVNKKIHVEVYEDSKGDVFNWIQAFVNSKHQSLVLTHLDNGGSVITTLIFSDAKIVEHGTEYDYNSSDVLMHKVSIGYLKVARSNETPEEKKCLTPA